MTLPRQPNRDLETGRQVVISGTVEVRAQSYVLLELAAAPFPSQAKEKRLRRRPTMFPTGREFRTAAAGSVVPGRLFRLVMRLLKLLQHS